MEKPFGRNTNAIIKRGSIRMVWWQGPVYQNSPGNKKLLFGWDEISIEE